jgi:hypothetical protein
VIEVTRRFVFARRRELPGELLKLMQDIMSQVFPPRLPAIAADNMSPKRLGFGKMPKLITY